MRNLICCLAFAIIALSPISANSAPRVITDPTGIPQPQSNVNNAAPKVYELPEEEMAKFLTERAKKASIVSSEDLKINNASHIEYSDEFKKSIQENNKSQFQKIFDNAAERINKKYNYNPEPATTNNENRQTWDNTEEPDTNTIKVTLPNLDTVMVPAREHIPYLYSRIEILDNGTVNFDKTIIVVANSGSNKAIKINLPTTTKNRLGDSQNIEYSLLGVTINDQVVEYELDDTANQISIKPKNNLGLENGIYTYNFKFMANRLISSYDDFDEFYWNLTGDSFNYVITKVGASIILPPNSKALGQNAFIGYPNRLIDNAASLEVNKNIVSTYSKIPLLKNEGMYIIVSIPKDAVIIDTLNNRFNWFIADYGDILLSIIGLIVIVISYYISWRYIKLNKVKIKTPLKKNSLINRYLAVGKIDNVSFVSFLLELYKKNIIDVEQSGDTILLIKKTDNIKSLTSNETKALKALFANDAVFNINSHNSIKIKRAEKFIEKDIKNKLKSFSLRLNLGYLAFSFAMLLFVEFSMAWLKYNSLSYLTVLITSTICFAGYIYILGIKFKNILMNIFVKAFTVAFIVISLIATSAIIKPISAIIILVSVYMIIDYTKLYSRRSGLMKFQINDVAELKNNLIKNKQQYSIGRDFLNQQANIFALEIQDLYPYQDSLKDYYKLDIASDILKHI